MFEEIQKFELLDNDFNYATEFNLKKHWLAPKLNYQKNLYIDDFEKFKCNDLCNYERLLCWRALAQFVDEINEKRFNINNKMMSKQDFETMDAIGLCKT